VEDLGEGLVGASEGARGEEVMGWVAGTVEGEELLTSSEDILSEIEL
jgi:hypothetical protein